MPSIDINTILTQALNAALATAVAEAVAPLIERIEKLEFCNAEYHGRLRVLEGALTDRVAALENNPAIGVDTTLERRVAALENIAAEYTPATITADAFVTRLDNQEWFWEKLTRKAKEVADAAVEQSMDNHLECYDHDNYDDIASKVDDMPDADDLVSKDDLSEAVRDAVSDLSFEISVR